MSYECPVCLYKGLDEPPENHEICPSCGTHFDYVDAVPEGQSKTPIHNRLREEWIGEGCKWWSKHKPNDYVLRIFMGAVR